MIRALVTLAFSGAVLALLRLALRPRARCTICGCEVDPDPCDVEPICRWHWGRGGDA